MRQRLLPLLSHPERPVEVLETSWVSLMAHECRIARKPSAQLVELIITRIWGQCAEQVRSEVEGSLYRLLESGLQSNTDTSVKAYSMNWAHLKIPEFMQNQCGLACVHWDCLERREFFLRSSKMLQQCPTDNSPQESDAQEDWVLVESQHDLIKAYEKHLVPDGASLIDRNVFHVQRLSVAPWESLDSV